MSELNTFSFYDLMARVEEETGCVVNFHKLLAVEQYSVTDTAFACGFSDPNYFSAVFHRLTGFTPKEFRRNNPRHK